MSTIKDNIKESIYSILTWSLKAAAREQGLGSVTASLEKIVPDIGEQYSTFKLDNVYLKMKARNLHAFQILLVNKIIDEFEKPVIVDIGDSAGTHLKYILGLHSSNKDIKCLSVNLDAKAIEKIKEKGLNAINARAEDLHRYNINADIFLCFEMLEHLMDPCKFLYQLSSKTNAKYLIVTVPYLRRSRVGLNYIKLDRRDNVCAENTHIFELNPSDWKLIAKHSGWDIVEERFYFQYPKMGLSRFTKLLWKKFDFEGFYGMILKRESTYSSRYGDWQENLRC